MAEVEIIGLIRFSFLGLEGRGSNGFAIKHETTEEKRAWLYERERLEFRLKLFEIVTLPCLLKQSSQDYKLIMMIGEDFPDWALARLNEMAIGTPLIVEKKPVMGILNAVSECFEKHFSDDCEKRVTFRLDDDDAFSLGWIAKLQEIAMELDWNEIEGDNFVTYLKHGLVLHNDHSQAQECGYIFPVRRFQPWSVGTVLISNRKSKLNAYSKVHIGLRKLFPSLPVTGDHALLRLFHGLNNTIDDFRTHRMSSKRAKNLDNWMKDRVLHFPDHFGIDLEELIGFLEIDEELFLEKLYA